MKTLLFILVNLLLFFFQKWLDMKDNPVNSELKLAVGECANENDCKKCARNVMKYAKWRGAEEDRQREIQLKLKRGKK